MIKKSLTFLIKALATILFLLLLVYLFRCCSAFGYKAFSDKSKDAAGTPAVVEAAIHINKGESLLEIGAELEKKSIIDNKYTFVVALRFMDDYDKISEGDYVVNSGQKPSEILSTLINKEGTGQ